MSAPYDSPVGECFYCGEPAVEEVDAENIDGDLIHDECLVMEKDLPRPVSLPTYLEMKTRIDARLAARSSDEPTSWATLE